MGYWKLLSLPRPLTVTWALFIGIVPFLGIVPYKGLIRDVQAYIWMGTLGVGGPETGIQ
ncbi:MAG: hypothetical protein Ct9H300mP28_04180 [Pseudomonadota bacterium]|nr:MAG: hypothetical protein Ct9H300mP28_04180 [Pseudomonadota bacterium]